MGQQQILFLLLGMCIIGIMMSVGLITLQGELAPDNRRVLIQDLHGIARQAQEYYRKPIILGGGEGTFLGLTANPHGMLKLIPKTSTARGDFFIRTAGGLESVELVAIGIERGMDRRFPVRVAMRVWADSVAVEVLN